MGGVFSQAQAPGQAEAPVQAQAEAPVQAQAQAPVQAQAEAPVQAPVQAQAQAQARVQSTPGQAPPRRVRRPPPPRVTAEEKDRIAQEEEQPDRIAEEAKTKNEQELKNINKLDENGVTPLCKAVLDLDKDKVIELLTKGADVNLGKDDTNTPIYFAIGNLIKLEGNNKDTKNIEDIINQLLDKGANPNPIINQTINGKNMIILLLDILERDKLNDKKLMYKTFVKAKNSQGYNKTLVDENIKKINDNSKKKVYDVTKEFGIKGGKKRKTSKKKNNKKKKRKSVKKR